MKLDAQTVEEYEENGYIVVEDLFDDSELETILGRIEEIAAGNTEFPAACIEYEPNRDSAAAPIDKLRKINQPARHDPLFLQHARNPKLLDVAESLLGPDVKFYDDQLFVKPPGGMEKAYHQDSPYFKIEPMALVSSWVALDDVTVENGCLYVVPGSHKKGAREHSEAWMVGDRQDKKIPDAVIDWEKEIPITLTAGSCSFHHSLLMHRSGPNKTSLRRRGLASHYMSAQSRWTGEPDERPDYPLLRGREYPGCV